MYRFMPWCAVISHPADRPVPAVARVPVAHRVAQARAAHRDRAGVQEVVDQADHQAAQVQVAHLVPAVVQEAVVRAAQAQVALPVVPALDQAAAIPIHAVVPATSYGQAPSGIRSKSSLPAKTQIHRFN